MSLIDVPDGKLAAVVTFLEMRERPAAADIGLSPLSLHPIRPTVAEYRDLFRAVGATWLWFSRLVMPEPNLRAIIDHPDVDLFEVRNACDVVGMLELDRRKAGECELSFVGLIPTYTGQGHGRWLLTEAIAQAWKPATHRVHVHTCSLDHPAALGAYRRAGFTAVARKVERFLDPRLAGILPRDCAPQVPLVEPSGN